MRKGRHTSLRFGTLSLQASLRRACALMTSQITDSCYDVMHDNCRMAHLLGHMTGPHGRTINVAKWPNGATHHWPGPLYMSSTMVRNVILTRPWCCGPSLKQKVHSLTSSADQARDWFPNIFNCHIVNWEPFRSVRNKHFAPRTAHLAIRGLGRL